MLFLSVFAYSGQGGNPCPTVLDADGMSESEMQAVAKKFGHESVFVFAPESADHDFLFRYFVPRHEMEMCGHATIGALWVLARAGRLKSDMVRVKTKSGIVTGFIERRGDDWNVAITQPPGKIATLGGEAVARILSVMNADMDDLADAPVSNAATSRVKTLIPFRDVARLNELAPSAAAVEAVCEAIGSTGLYPYAVLERGKQHFEARQFPKSSGYPEDAATGIAAAALAFGLLGCGLIARDDRVTRIFQGRAMGRLSAIDVRIAFAGDHAAGCLLGGDVVEIDM